MQTLPNFQKQAILISVRAQQTNVVFFPHRLYIYTYTSICFNRIEISWSVKCLLCLVYGYYSHGHE